MTQLEKFSFHLPYKVIIKDTKYGSIFNSLDFITDENQDTLGCFNGKFDQLIKDKILKPYLRSFDQLTKECVQADYNDGKPFVPVEEIKKELFHSDMEWGKHTAYEWIGFSDNKSNHIPVLFLNDFSEECPFWIFNLLLKWHFCVGFEQGEYIEVTNENNPY